MIMCIGEDKQTSVAEWLTGKMMDSRNAKPLVEKGTLRHWHSRKSTCALFDSPSMRIYLTIVSRLCNFRITNVSDSAANSRAFRTSKPR